MMNKYVWCSVFAFVVTSNVQIFIHLVQNTAYSLSDMNDILYLITYKFKHVQFAGTILTSDLP